MKKGTGINVFVLTTTNYSGTMLTFQIISSDKMLGNDSLVSFSLKSFIQHSVLLVHPIYYRVSWPLLCNKRFIINFFFALIDKQTNKWNDIQFDPIRRSIVDKDIFISISILKQKKNFVFFFFLLLFLCCNIAIFYRFVQSLLL